MFEKFLSENIDNFRQRYEGTYGFYKTGSKRLLVKLVGISADQCSFVDSRDISFSIRPDHPDDVGFEFLPPKSQWYNTKNGAVFTQRLAHRQFQRGITSKNLEILRLKKGELQPIRVDFRNLSDIYERGLTPKEALRNLDSGQSVGISGQFALDGDKSVFLLREFIGVYKQKDKVFTIELKEPQLWRTEISDALAAMGCSAEIK